MAETTVPSEYEPPQRDQGQIETSSKVEEAKTHCRICEPQCALVATLENGILTKVRGNSDNPFSQGHLCVKAGAAIDVVYDQDRVLEPLRRVGGPGEFEPVGWDEALDDIASRLSEIQAEHGPESFAAFPGNPVGFNYAASFFVSGFMAALKMKWKYGVASDDSAARQVASALLYGSMSILPKPDIWRTDFVLIVGANPKVAHSSTVAEPKFLEGLRQVKSRGGRVVVVDPRRTETAKEFEHVPIVAGEDSWMLIGMIKDIIDNNLHDEDYIHEHVGKFEEFKYHLRDFDVAECAARAGLTPDRLKALAREFATAESACIYARTGTCTQFFGTLTNLLLDTLLAITGNLEKPGGGVFGWTPIDFEKFAEAAGWSSYNTNPTRVFQHPDVFGFHPSTSLVPDIEVPGKGQIKALMTMGGNPVMSSGAGGPAMEAALRKLDFHFSLDMYVSETNKYADYILPVPTFYEREDAPLLSMGEMLRPAIWFSSAVLPVQGNCRSEWEILNDICARMGVGGAYASPLMRRLAKMGIKIRPDQLFDLLLRTSRVGDNFGLKPSGLNLKKLKSSPDGIEFFDQSPVTSVGDRMKTADKKVNICAEVLISELKRRREYAVDENYPMRMFGRREVKSINSWLHNAKRVMPNGRTSRVMIHPNDAEKYQIRADQSIKVSSNSGSIVLPVEISDDVTPGQICVPHGWGHSGGWKRANAAGGANANILASGARENLEPIAGMSVFNGIPVSISPIV